jgi:hypothetical protein
MNSSNLGDKIQSFSTKMSNSFEKGRNAVLQRFERVSNGASNAISKVQNSASQASSSSMFRNLFSGYESTSSQVKEFAEANSTISKVVFIIFLLILFGILLRVGMYLIASLFAPPKSPHVIKGMRPTSKGKKYQVNPNEKNSRPILRSINEDQGMEFTWSCWIWMEDTEYSDKTTSKVIFTKGKGISDENNEKIKMMSSPGLFANPTNNEIEIVMAKHFDSNMVGKSYESIKIDNIPMQKWVNVVIRIQNNTVDVYINGTLTERKELDYVPKQNYGNIYVGDVMNGMHGYISSLRYFNYAIGEGQIQDMIYRGPNLKMEGEGYNETMPPYLSMKWYFNK